MAPSTIVTAKRAAGGMLSRAASPTILLGMAAPFTCYEILTAHGFSELSALAVGAVFPLAVAAWSALRRRHLDRIAMISLAAILMGLGGGLLFNSPEFLLVKDSIITGSIGVAFLVSLATARPLTFVFSQELSNDPAARERLDAQWDDPAVQARHRRLSLAWGLALLTEAALRVVVSLLVSPAALLLISPLLAAAVFAPMAAWTLHRSHSYGATVHTT